MKEVIIKELEERINTLKETQSQYSYVEEDKEISNLEVKMDDLLVKRNNKKSIFDGYRKDISKIEMTISNIQDIIKD